MSINNFLLEILLDSRTREHSVKPFKERSRLNISKYLFLVVLLAAGTASLIM